jgi:hypothetical protein
MEKIKDFLNIQFKKDSGSGYGDGSGDGDGYGNGSGYGSGYGDGSGSGYGYGDGSGDGSSDGDGYGDGYGDGSGDGYGSGYGYGDGNSILTFESFPVFNIDNICTIVTLVRNNIAKGFILNSDFTKTPCFIVKENNLFAHGSTLKEAFQSLQEKLYNDYSLEERILKFKEMFKDFSLKYSASDFFSWHNILTGSCEMGRLSFAKDRDINIEKDQFTVYEFIDLTKDSYNGDNIKALLNN